MSRLNDLLLLTYVPRWGIIPMARPESVAEHTFRVAVIAFEIAQRYGVETAPVLYRALIHDGPEAGTGDIASPVKEPLADLPELERALCSWWEPGKPPRDVLDHIVKIADLIDLQVYLGNHGLGRVGGVKLWAQNRMSKQYKLALDRVPQALQQIAIDVHREASILHSPWEKMEEGK